MADSQYIQICHIDKHSEIGGSTWWYVRLPDGYMLECGHGEFGHKRAGRLALSLEQGDGWRCTGCGDIVPPEHVTFDERHDERAGGCGAKVR